MVAISLVGQLATGLAELQDKEIEAGNAMDDFFVDRNADTAGKSLVSEKRRSGSELDKHVSGEQIEYRASSRLVESSARRAGEESKRRARPVAYCSIHAVV